LQTRKWTDNSGVEKYTTEIVLSRFRGEMVMLDGRSDSNQSYAPPAGTAKPLNQSSEPSFDIPGNSSASRSAPTTVDFDDEIPF
jgi:single-strand DNA-binding protein